MKQSEDIIGKAKSIANIVNLAKGSGDFTKVDAKPNSRVRKKLDEDSEVIKPPINYISDE